MGKNDNGVVYVTLFVIAVIAVVGILKLYGFGTSEFTGFGASLATIKMNMSPTLDITLTDANITFGNGAAYANSTLVVIDTCGDAVQNGTWSVVNDPFRLENTGNILANVSVAATSTAATWLGGTSGGGPNFYYNYTSNRTAPLNSCLTDGEFANSTWSAAASTTAINLCQKFNFTDASDSLRIDLKLAIPGDAPYGLKTNSFTFSATASG